MKLSSLDAKDVKETLDSFDEKNVRYEGYKYSVVNDEIHLLGWQYTRLNFPNNNILLHIFLNVVVDKDLKIKYINLFDDFSGSQGIKCNRNILNEHINNVFIGEVLSIKNPKIKDYKQAYCRHVYEILYGMSDFIEVCNGKTDSFYYEKTKVNIGLFKIKLLTNIYYNNKNYSVNTIIGGINRIKLDNKYNIINTNNLTIKSVVDNEEILNVHINSKSNTEFYQNLLKNIFKIWNSINVKMEFNNSLSFSALFPTSLYSFIVQLVTVYKKIYDKNALKKCLDNFQIINNKALCLGFEKDEKNNL